MFMDIEEVEPTKGERAEALTGRDLDAAVAERVMGWTIAPEGNRWRVSATGEYINSWCVDSPNLADLDSDVDDRLYGRYAMPSYSTDIAAAMQVVEKMQERGFRIFIRDYEGVITWEVKFASVKGPSYEASGNDLPEAICRAALQAIDSLPGSPG